MKKIIFLAGFILFLKSYCFTQSNEPAKSHPDRYRLDLPPELSTPKLIRIITYILPETMLELKQLDFCTSCKALYIVKFIIDSVSTDISVNPATYSFKATLRVFDSTGTPVSQLLIISPLEIFETLNPAQVRKNNPAEYMEETINVYDDSGTILVGSIPVIMANPSFDNFNFTRNNKLYKLISRDDMVNICKRKIIQIKRMLKKLSESGLL